MCTTHKELNGTADDWKNIDERWEQDSAAHPGSAPVTFNKFDPEAVLPGAPTAKTPAFKCNKCHGTGVVRFGYHNPQQGKCHACNGRGGFATSATTRAKAKNSRMQKLAKKADDIAEKLLEFKKQQPDVWAALMDGAAKGNNFCISLCDQLTRKGELSEKQVDSMKRGIAKRNEWREQQAAAAPLVPEGQQKLYSSLQQARHNGLKYPKIRVGSLAFSLASASSPNIGSVYVKSGDLYLGKIDPKGRWMKTHACSPENDALVQRVCLDPLTEAIAHGIETGHCSCCGRELTDPESVARGIGPICADRFGW